MSRRACVLTALTAACAVVLGGAAAGRARADSGAPLGESSRSAGLADAVTADPRGGAAIHFNPGALARVERSVFDVGAHVGRVSLWFARRGEPGLRTDQPVAGFQGSLVVRLPGPRWLRRVRIGAAAHVPSAYALQIRAPARRDVPRAPYYGDRVGRTALTMSAGVELPYGLGVGVGATLTPTLWAPTLVRYDASHSDDPDRNVRVDIERELRIGAAALAGLSYRPIEELSLGFAWHQMQSVRAVGFNDTTAGPIRVDAAIDFFEFYAPEEWSVGAAATVFGRLRLSADLVWARWSRYLSIHHERPDPPFRDVLDLRVGAEWRVRPMLTVRAGWALEPTPVPAQRGETNFIDADRQVLALGLGFDLESMGWARMRVDVHLRWHLLAAQRADKTASRLPDADARLEGRQVDNLGWPGFSAGGTLAQVGVTLTLPLTAPARGAR